ncbi:o-methyltransferase [Thermoascus aurantiacus ATCC 26904]
MPASNSNSNDISNGPANGHSNRSSNGTSNGTSNGSQAIKDPSIDLIATSPCDGESVPGLLAEIASYGEVFSHNDRRGRLQLLRAARSLVRALETPRETIIRLCWAEGTLYAAIDTAIRMGLFSLMASDDCSPKKVDELASRTGAEPALLSRIMKHLATMGIIQETGPDEYRPTNLSRTLAVPKYADGFPCMGWQLRHRRHLQAPEYLSKTGYKNTTNPVDGPFQCAFNKSQHWFAWAHDDQPVLMQFNNHMGAYRQGRPSWMDPDFYPVQELLVKGARTDEDAVLLVDVGGSLGHDIEEFHRKHPTAPGRLIERIDPAIEPMAYDFFTESLSKVCARAYYLHSILHDWPDDVCLQILARLTAAMKPGYSKLLVNENVIPDIEADWQLTALDLMMMTMVSSGERKEQQWRQLLEKAGLKILKIWSYENGVESLIECELA